MAVREDIAKWFELAREDFDEAELLLRNGYMRGAMFHLQQAAEKSIKGWLLANGWQLMKTHDLIVLANKMKEFGKELSNIIDDLDILSACYIDNGYPVAESISLSNEYIKALFGGISNLITELKDEII